MTQGNDDLQELHQRLHSLLGASDDVEPEKLRMTRREVAQTWSAVVLVLLWAIIGPFRGYIVDGVHDAVHSKALDYRGAWGITLVAATFVFLALTGILKLRIQKLDGEGSRYWGWWWTGAALITLPRILKNLLLTQGATSLWILLGVLVPLSLAGMALVLISGLNADPLTVFSQQARLRHSRDWERVRSTVPLFTGVVVVAAALSILFPNYVREGAVKESYFHEVLSLLPVLLLTLAIELKFFRGRGATNNRSSQLASRPDPVLRAAPIATGIMIALAIVLAASTLTYDHSRGTAAWHQFIAFAFSVQATTTALATVLWRAFASE